MPDALPPSATPLDPDEAEGLIPGHVANRRELDAWEQLNIANAVGWLRRQRGLESILSMGLLRELHRRMFSDTWTWAGRFRSTLKSIGVAPEAITEHIHNLLADVRYWVDHGSYTADEIGVRFHHRLVAIHPFSNGNGRHARLLTDALLTALNVAPFTWGSGSIDDRGEVRSRYIRALHAADLGDCTPLRAFVRS